MKKASPVSIEQATQFLARVRLEERLELYSPRPVSRMTAPKRAAVACLLRYRASWPEVLLIKRVDREGDRWSGHMAFPGGKAEPQDNSLLQTAIRETNEEVGLNLAEGARLIGQLDDLRAIAKGKMLPMAITPFVFLQTQEGQIALNHEAESYVWLPLHRVLSGELDDTYDYKLGPVPLRFGCWRYQDKVVWGLTYRMLNDLLRVATAV